MTRADALANATRWAAEADRRHDTMNDTAITRNRLDWADAARQMAVMWATLAQLLTPAADRG